MSVLADILSAVVTDHQNAALKIGGESLRIVKRKLPKREEGVDVSYQVTISGAEDVDRIERIAFGSVFRVQYRIEMTLVIPNDRDQLTNLDDVANWREATRARYMKPNPIAVAQVKRVEIEDGALFNRTTLSEGYDFDQVVINVWTFERRS